MRLFVTDRQLDSLVRKRNQFWMAGIATNAAKEALHGFVDFRTFEWWERTIAEAKANKRSYMSLAEAFTKIQEENK